MAGKDWKCSRLVPVRRRRTDLPKFRNRAVQFDAHSSQAVRSWSNIDNLSLALMPGRRVHKQKFLS